MLAHDGAPLAGRPDADYCLVKLKTAYDAGDASPDLASGTPPAPRELPAGTKLEVRVTRRGAIGAYVAYRIQRGNFKKGPDRCMNPGSRKPRRRCG